jgi:hypothetical protein
MIGGISAGALLLPHRRQDKASPEEELGGQTALSVMVG